MSRGAIDVSDLDVITDGYRGDLVAACSQLTAERALDSAATVSLTLRDPTRRLVDGPLLRAGARLSLGDRLPVELVAVQRRGRELATTWQCLASLALQDDDDTEVTAPDATDVFRFAFQLIREATTADGSTIEALVEPGPVRLADDETADGAGQLGRGGDTADGDAESSWDALARIGDMCDPPRRRWSYGRLVAFASDRWLADGHTIDVDAGGDGHRWREGRGGVDRIDYSWDVGRRADSAQVDVWVPDIHRVSPGQPVRLDEPGDAAAGTWLVEKVTWTAGTRRTRVALTRPADLRENG